MSAYDEFMATFGDIVQPTAPAVVSASIGIDPCARLTVQPVAGGMSDAPVVKHAMRMKRSQKCRRECGRKCRRDCEKIYALDPDLHPDGECLCPLVNVAAHYDAQAGVRSHGTPAPFKRMERGRFADHTEFADTPRTFVSTGGLATRKPTRPRWPLAQRTFSLALFFLHVLDGTETAICAGFLRILTEEV